MSQSSISLMRMTSVARSATICPMASPLIVSSICRAKKTIDKHSIDLMLVSSYPGEHEACKALKYTCTQYRCGMFVRGYTPLA